MYLWWKYMYIDIGGLFMYRTSKSFFCAWSTLTTKNYDLHSTIGNEVHVRTVIVKSNDRTIVKGSDENVGKDYI